MHLETSTYVKTASTVRTITVTTVVARIAVQTVAILRVMVMVAATAVATNPPGYPRPYISTIFVSFSHEHRLTNKTNKPKRAGHAYSESLTTDMMFLCYTRMLFSLLILM